jgi:hypothetical protein
MVTEVYHHQPPWHPCQRVLFWLLGPLQWNGSCSVGSVTVSKEPRFLWPSQRGQNSLVHSGIRSHWSSCPGCYGRAKTEKEHSKKWEEILILMECCVLASCKVWYVYIEAYCVVWISPSPQCRPVGRPWRPPAWQSEGGPEAPVPSTCTSSYTCGREGGKGGWNLLYSSYI